MFSHLFIPNKTDSASLNTQIIEQMTHKSHNLNTFTEIFRHNVTIYRSSFWTFTKETYWKLSSPKRILFCFLKRILCSSFSLFLFCSMYSTDERGELCVLNIFTGMTFERVRSDSEIEGYIKPKQHHSPHINAARVLLWLSGFHPLLFLFCHSLNVEKSYKRMIPTILNAWNLWFSNQHILIKFKWFEMKIVKIATKRWSSRETNLIFTTFFGNIWIPRVLNMST